MRLIAAVLCTMVTACATEEAPVGYGMDLGTPENPIPREEPYSVTTRVDLAAQTVAPPPVAQAVASLRALSQNPAGTLMTLADQGGVSAVDELAAALPQALDDRLEGWINTELDKIRIATKTLRQYATDTAGIAEATLTELRIESRLSFTPTTGMHTLTGLNFTPAGLDIVVPIGGFAADVHTQRPVVSVAQAGAVTLGEQKFGIALGDHAWSGINLASKSLYGSDVRTTLVNAVNCTALASAIAARCYNGACVGHESQVKAICDGGIDVLVDQLQDKMTAFSLDIFELDEGTARLVDDGQDGEADRIADGTWRIELNLGLGLRTVTAPFSALY